MSKNWNYVSGDWNVICDVCSKKIKASEAKQRWDGFIVCKDDYEQRQPLDFIRARQDKISVPYTRPVPTDTFVPQNFTENFTDQVYQIEESLSRVVTYIREFSDSVVMSDTDIAYGYGRPLTDTISFSDVLESVLVTQLELTDSTSVTDSIVNSIGKTLTDTATVTEVLTTTVSKVLEDSVAATESLQYLLEKTLSDSTTVTDTLGLAIGSSLSDSTTFSDSLTSVTLSSEAVNGSTVNNQVIN